MDRASALRQLPAAYARALRLRDLGVDDDGVAKFLDIPAESIPALFRIAEAKLLEISGPPIEISEPLGKCGGAEGDGSSPVPREDEGRVP